MVRFSSEARERYTQFGTQQAEWRANFRDLNSSITRMATLADGGRITLETVEQEIQLLTKRWGGQAPAASALSQWLAADKLTDIDEFDQVQLEHVIGVCQSSTSLAVAGRRLFNASRQKKRSNNDSHRLKQYLSKFDLEFDQL